MQYRVKVFGAPLLNGLRIHEQACRAGGGQACAVVDYLFAGAPLHAGPGVQLQLAGSVVAAVADHAALFDDGFDLRRVIAVGKRGTREQQDRKKWED